MNKRTFFAKFISLVCASARPLHYYNHTRLYTLKFVIKMHCSGAEQKLPRRSARLIPKKRRPCRELPDVIISSKDTFCCETGCGKVR